ncbi:MAG: Bax inhibitor-1/YccA family protein [Betaproteobacteria bacterium]|jgi:FtsH-binding integral membrane protein|nr:Bax inhibitor-1/YccA family protein [Betaproteobacteria bacterium]
MQPELRPIQGNTLTGTQDIAVRQNKVLRNTYLLLAVTLIPTAIGALLGANLNLSFLRTNPIISLFAILGIFYGWIWAIEKNRNSGMGVALLLGFTLFLGVLLGPVLQRVLGFANGGQLVAMAAGGTAVTFFGLSAVASSVKRDFSGMGRFLLVGFIVIMLAVVANVFFQIPALALTILVAFIIFSSMIILYQVNAIVRGGETNYISATLTLYVAIYNIFSSLLQLLGIFGGEGD